MAHSKCLSKVVPFKYAYLNTYFILEDLFYLLVHAFKCTYEIDKILYKNNIMMSPLIYIYVYVHKYAL